MELFWWLIAIVLMAAGLLGTVLPIVPGTMMILAGAVIHRMMLGAEKSISWWIMGVLVLLVLLSFLVDFASGYFGARHFGATRWGTVGAIAGALVGIFFGLPGLIVGPVLGAIAGEFVAGRQLVKAGRAGWGALLGNMAGIIAKLLIALTMISLFLISAPEPF